MSLLLALDLLRNFTGSAWESQEDEYLTTSSGPATCASANARLEKNIEMVKNAQLVFRADQVCADGESTGKLVPSCDRDATARYRKLLPRRSRIMP